MNIVDRYLASKRYQISKNINENDICCLLALSKGDDTITRLSEHWSASWYLAKSSVARLVEDGLAVKVSKDSKKDRVFSITNAGERVVAEYLKLI